MCMRLCRVCMCSATREELISTTSAWSACTHGTRAYTYIHTYIYTYIHTYTHVNTHREAEQEDERVGYMTVEDEGPEAYDDEQ